ncbi:MAG: hypothetical protein P8J14_04825 [Emcibacteraceae bacterium]|nr:hypothetical protein [Emcibacteraceae bacterium]
MSVQKNSGDLITFESGTLFGRIIRIGQRLLGRKRNSAVIHVALCYGGGTLIFDSVIGHGVRLRPLDDKNPSWKNVKHHPLKVPLTSIENEQLAEFINLYHGNTKYERSLKELFMSVFDFNKNQKPDTRYFFCSELVAEFMQRIGRLPPYKSSNEYTPQDIANSFLWRKTNAK